MIGKTIEITTLYDKAPLYRMDVTKVSESGFHGTYRCNFGEGWEDYATDKKTGTRSIGLILHDQYRKVEIVE